MDTIIWESDAVVGGSEVTAVSGDVSAAAVGEAQRETYKSFPLLRSRIHAFLVQSLRQLGMCCLLLLFFAIDCVCGMYVHTKHT